MAYGHLKQYQKSVDALLQAVRLNPSNSNAWSHLGLACIMLNRYNSAIDYLIEALKLDFNNDSALASLGLAYFLSGDRELATIVAKELSPRDAEKANTLFNLINGN